MLDDILTSSEPLRQAILNHPIYNRMVTLEDLQLFMQSHVVAVWDFMSLLKALQIELTSTSVPWVPKGDPAIRRMINDIVLAEESDDFGDGVVLSHFEFYVKAMAQIGADIRPIQQFIDAVSAGVSVNTAAAEAHFSEGCQQFVSNTFDLIRSGSLHDIAAVFAFTREGLIPDMFNHIVQGLNDQFPKEVGLFSQYLDRHIALDSDLHGPLAMKMVVHLCDGDPKKISSARVAVSQALEARLRLWDGILIR